MAPSKPGEAPGEAVPPPDGLTQREVEILGLIARGLTNPEIAEQLFLSSHTIKTHINRIFAKNRVAGPGGRHRLRAPPPHRLTAWTTARRGCWTQWRTLCRDDHFLFLALRECGRFHAGAHETTT